MFHIGQGSLQISERLVQQLLLLLGCIRQGRTLQGIVIGPFQIAIQRPRETGDKIAQRFEIAFRILPAGKEI